MSGPLIPPRATYGKSATIHALKIIVEPILGLETDGKRWEGGWRAVEEVKGWKTIMEGGLTWGGEHTIQCTDGVL